MLIRVIIAVIAVVLFYALLDPVMQVFRFPLSGPVRTIITVCVAGIAVYYVLKGRLPS